MEINKHINIPLRTSIVALAYVMHKTPFVFPIIGGRKVEQLQGNIDALRIKLSDEQMKYLESVLPFDPGFPNWMIVSINSPLDSCRCFLVEA
jgi:diketogulonate reductase-like aldo/keto reductase